MKIGLDKILHFAACYMVVIIIGVQVKGASNVYGTGIPNYVIGAIGADVALILGIMKETYDRLQGNKFDFADLLADLVGTLAGFLCILGL